MKQNPRAAHIARLQAILEILGYGGWGGQKRFAEEIEMEPNNFNKICKGYPLSMCCARAIRKRFKISLDFLVYGDGTALPHRLERELRHGSGKRGGASSIQKTERQPSTPALPSPVGPSQT